MDDPDSMARQQKGRHRPVKGAGGGTVCALCGRVIKAGNATGDEPVIYSVCAACKRMPRLNPGSTASFC